MSPTAIDDPRRLFRPRPFPERLWAFLCTPATGVADRLRGDAGGSSSSTALTGRRPFGPTPTLPG
jgi:hypothetical protein